MSVRASPVQSTRCILITSAIVATLTVSSPSMTVLAYSVSSLQHPLQPLQPLVSSKTVQYSEYSLGSGVSTTTPLSSTATKLRTPHHTRSKQPTLPLSKKEGRRCVSTQSSSSHHHYEGTESSSRSILLSSRFGDFSKLMQTAFYASLDGASLAVRQSWWCFPMILALVPLYCTAVLGAPATMPSWWAMQRLDHLKESNIGIMVVGGFLLSNIFYFLSGLYLLNYIPPILQHNPQQQSLVTNHDEHGTTGGGARESLRMSIKKSAPYHYSRYPLLGILVLACGGISAIFHSVQALGPPLIAESLCYVDHGLAISSFFYFLGRCGLPSLKTLAIGASGMALLAAPGAASYAWYHSVWHLLSAGVTISWASDGVARRKRFIVDSLRDERLKNRTSRQ